MQNILFTQLKIKTHLNNIITTKTVTKNNCLFRRNKGSQTCKQKRQRGGGEKGCQRKNYSITTGEAR